DTTVRLWNVIDGTEQVVWRGHQGRVQAVRFHPTGRMLASGGSQPAEVKLWDLTRHPEHDRVTPPRPGAFVEALGFAGDGKALVVQRIGGEVETREVVSGQLRQGWNLPITGEWLTPASVGAVSGDGSRLAAVRKDDPRRVSVWDLRTGKELSM